MVKGKKNKSFFENLRYKYRLVIINDDTFEQKASVKLSKFNIYVGVGVFMLFMIAFVTFLIAFTGLKYYLPGMGGVNFRNQVSQMDYKTDSLNQELNKRNLWLKNIQNIVSGNLDSTYFLKDDSSRVKINIDSIDLNATSEQDKQLREEVSQIKSEVTIAANEEDLMDITSEDVFSGLSMKMKFIAPFEGIVVKKYSVKDEHFGIDIAGLESEAIKSIYDGTVIISEWNPKTGYVIAVQHPNNTISFYKHNSILLKKIGTFVKKGEILAIIGNSGEYSSGPHLHFEIWQNGKVQDPLKFINLEKIN